MIQESTIAELDPRQVKQVEAADKAALTNPSYSVEIYSAILKLSPGCLELRKKLRTLQFRMAQKSTKGFSSPFGKVTAAPSCSVEKETRTRLLPWLKRKS